MLLAVAGCDSGTADRDVDGGPDGGPHGGPFGFPIADPSVIHQYIGVDHDPDVHDSQFGAAICTGYDGRTFPWCYDEHDGSDYLLEGDFGALDAGSVAVLAAAAGTVTSVHDGEYDRCHNDGTEVSCDGYPIVANHVIIAHDDGLSTMYWHLAKGSIAVTEGDRVACGDRLALIGSSGVSAVPHLHFQVEDDAGNVIDPYAGSESQATTYWDDQGHPEGLPGPGCTAR